uniref:Uncharacterized protein n=1 Tax=Romanomermis culicivorax TaxID=13658 RepID=A0A915KRG9_ROMCU
MEELQSFRGQDKLVMFRLTETVELTITQRLFKSLTLFSDHCDDILVDASKFPLPRRPQLSSTNGSVISTRSESSSSFRNNNDRNNIAVIPPASSLFTDRHVYRNQLPSIQRQQNHRRPPASAPPASAETALIGTFFNFPSSEHSDSPPSSPPSPFTDGGGSTATDFQINYCEIAPNVGAITPSSLLRNGSLPPFLSGFRQNCDHPISSTSTLHLSSAKSNSACVSRRNSNEEDDDEEQQYYRNHNCTTFQTAAPPSSFQHSLQTRDQKIPKTLDSARFEYAKIDEVATKAISKVSFSLRNFSAPFDKVYFVLLFQLVCKQSSLNFWQNFMVRSRFEQPLISSQTLPRNACGRDTLPSIKATQKGGKLLRKGANLLRRRTSLTSLLNQ